MEDPQTHRIERAHKRQLTKGERYPVPGLVALARGLQPPGGLAVELKRSATRAKAASAVYTRFNPKSSSGGIRITAPSTKTPKTNFCHVQWVNTLEHFQSVDLHDT